MPIIVELLGILILIIIGFYLFRFLARSGKAEKAFNFESPEDTVHVISEEKELLLERLERRKNILKNKEKLIKDELGDSEFGEKNP